MKMFKEYEKAGKIIQATPFMFNAIYKAQGYKPRGENNGQVASSGEDNADSAKSLSKHRKSE